jgi:hypothetical protein
MQPLGRNRWVLFHRGDRLVHRVMPMYRTVYTNYKDKVYPDHGITECGHQVLLLPNTAGECKEGHYTSDDRLLTCIQCLSGVAKTGILTRQEQKNLLFAQMYGQPGRKSLNYPVQAAAAHVAMQNLPAKPVADYSTIKGYGYDQAFVDEVKSLKGFAEVEAILASWLAPLPKS